MTTLLTDTSKFLSFVLRHDPGAIGLTLDREGWADIDTLVACANRNGRSIDRPLVLDVVATNDKQRFAMSDDGQRIRAVQGHSTASVAIERPAAVPPATLFHGTAARFLDAILREGLRPGQRHHVHLSADPATAQSVGARYGRPVVLRVDAAGMQSEGITFHQAENGVWLCEHVPQRFLEVPPGG